MKAYLKNRTSTVSYKEKNRCFYSIVAFIFIIMTFLNGCKKETETVLSLSTNALEFSFANEQKSVEISSNTKWTVSSDVSSWLTFSPLSGSNNGVLMITVTENETVSTRSAKITVNGDGLTQTVSVSQEGAEPVLSLSTDTLEFSFAGEQKSVEISSNTDWTVSSDDSSWLTIAPLSGSNNGVVMITASENETVSARSAIITVKGDGLSQKVGVSQEGVPPVLTVSIESISFRYSAEQTTFTITSNIDWTISVNAESSSWLSVSPTSSSSNSSRITVSVKQNDSSTEYRGGMITVSGGGITRNISVLQGLAPFINVSPTTLTLSEDGDMKSFAVQSNCNWTISSNQTDWLNISPTSGFSDRTVTVTATTNNSFYSERIGTITVLGENSTWATIVVTQMRREIDLDISAGSGGMYNFHFEYQGGQQTFTIKVPKPPVNWTVETSSSAASWIKISPSSGTNDATITVVASRNTSSYREGFITIKGGNVEQKMPIEQESGIGNVTFWTSVDYRCGAITVTLSGQGSRTIDGFYYSGSPYCGDQYTATFNNIPRGTYTYTATCSGGRSWSGTITVNSNCITRRIY